jgi:5-methylcytosine-specific restriction endonuclease McrA
LPPLSFPQPLVVPSRAERSRRRAAAFGYEGEHFTDEEWPSLLERFGGACLRCGSTEDLSADHVVPLCLGGANAVSNLQPLCVRCNGEKGATVRDYRPGASRGVRA